MLKIVFAQYGKLLVTLKKAGRMGFFEQSTNVVASVAERMSGDGGLERSEVVIKLLAKDAFRKSKVVLLALVRVGTL